MSVLPDLSGKSPCRALVVDDEEIVCVTLARVFGAKGYETRKACSAEDASALLATWLPDVAIIDVNLGQVNGVELAIFVLAASPSCRVLLFSGHPDTVDIIERARKAGHAFELVAKPVHPQVLLDWAQGMRSPATEQ